MVAQVHRGRHSDARIKSHHLDLDTGDLGHPPSQSTHAKQSAAGSDSQFDDGHLPLSKVTRVPRGFQGRESTFSRPHQIKGDFGAKGSEDLDK